MSLADPDIAAADLATAARALTGPAAWPGGAVEPVFAEPWEGRAFGMAFDVVGRASLSWDAFRDRLIAALADEPLRPYFQSWVIALETLVADQSGITAGALRARRLDVASYRFVDTAGRDIEVFPFRLDERGRAVLADLLPADELVEIMQAELYRLWSDEQPVAWGVRAFARDGSLMFDTPVAHGGADAWQAMLATLLEL